MKKLIVLAAAALALAACAKQEKVPVAPEADGPVAVAFDSYINRGVTRAGKTADMVLDSLKKSGFGVFAYYTDDGNYDDTATPNFMYNQKVTFGTSWEYTPVKYWPNEYKTNANSEELDKLTFFAYAPYVEVVPSTGKIEGDATEQTWGITALPRNTAANDPLVKYIASFDAAKSVDLLWGVNNDYDGTAVWETTSGVNQDDLVKGKPWIDVQRPALATSGQRVKFQFLHATSKLNVQIAYYADKQSNTSTETINAAQTKIYVRSITFSGMATKGALNLNNTKENEALWMDYAGTNDLELGETVTIYDGRKDGKEGVAGAVAANEKLTGFNPELVQKETATTGVTGTLQNLFTGTAANTPVFIIPTGEVVNVEIVYDVETADPNLATYLSDGTTHGSSIENRIYKEAIFGAGVGFENGKAYTINLYLGMNSVKFDAGVTGWADQTPVNVDLPANQN